MRAMLGMGRGKEMRLVRVKWLFQATAVFVCLGTRMHTSIEQGPSLSQVPISYLFVALLE